MDRLIPVGLLAFAMTASAAQVTPAINNLGSAPDAAATQTSAQPARSTNVAIPADLSIAAQLNAGNPSATQSNQSVVATGTAQPAQANTLVNVSGPSVKPKPKPTYKMPRTPAGHPVYLVQTSNPMTETTFYSGSCPAVALPEFRQKAKDLGLLGRNGKTLHSLVVTTETGRDVGCWYFDSISGSYKTLTEKGYGEEFALEQMDRLEPEAGSHAVVVNKEVERPLMATKKQHHKVLRHLTHKRRHTRAQCSVTPTE